jgi:hypothetical protein
VADPRPVRRTFDEAYFRRFYDADPVHDGELVAALASAVVGFCTWWGVTVASVLDVGAGPGLWRDWFDANRPDVRYHGIDASPYACARWGHELADIAGWTPPEAYDVVVCQGVLQYLDDAGASAAIANLARATAAVLYLEVPTASDLEQTIDHDASDLDVHWRTGDWYRRRLAPRFVAVGAGLWARRTARLRFYELETGLRRGDTSRRGTLS